MSGITLIIVIPLWVAIAAVLIAGWRYRERIVPLDGREQR
jgi:hypothetical protein